MLLLGPGKVLIISVEGTTTLKREIAPRKTLLTAPVHPDPVEMIQLYLEVAMSIDKFMNSSCTSRFCEDNTTIPGGYQGH